MNNNPTGKGGFVKGVSGNPKGKPVRPEIQLLREAMERAKEETGVDLLDHYVQQAYKDNSILNAIMKKILPDLKQLDIDMNAIVDGNLNLQHMSDEEIRAELKKLRSRKNGNKPASGASGKKSNRKGADSGKGNGSKKKPE